jgi:hypothetical protein
MTIITSPIAPEMTRRPGKPLTLGAVIEAIRRLIGRKKKPAGDRGAARRLAADVTGQRHLGGERAEIERRFRGVVEARRDLRWG